MLPPVASAGTSVDGNACAGDPAGLIRREESDYIRDILRLADALQRLHIQRDLTAGFRLGEVRR